MHENPSINVVLPLLQMGISIKICLSLFSAQIIVMTSSDLLLRTNMTLGMLHHDHECSMVPNVTYMYTVVYSIAVVYGLSKGLTILMMHSQCRTIITDKKIIVDNT